MVFAWNINMKKDEREVFNLINKVKEHIQDHIVMKPIALSNFHHFADRLLDHRDGSFEKFKRNIKEMLKYTEPMNQRGKWMIGWLSVFVVHGENIVDFVNVAYTILEI